MKKMKVLKATKEHKKFIIHANNVINNVNDTEQTNRLEQNIDKDYFCDNPKFQCLVAEIDDKPVGMILYSYFYWANDGEVLWISQMFVEEEYRKYGVFFKLIEKLREKIYKYEKENDIQITKLNNGEFIEIEYNKKKFHKSFDFFTYFEYNNYRKMRYHRNVAYRLINILN